MCKEYKIVRVYRDSDRRDTIRRHLSLAEAQKHCRNPETSSSTATSFSAQRRTELHGPWFDSYEEM